MYDECWDAAGGGAFQIDRKTVLVEPGLDKDGNPLEDEEVKAEVQRESARESGREGEREGGEGEGGREGGRDRDMWECVGEFHISRACKRVSRSFGRVVTFGAVKNNRTSRRLSSMGKTSCPSVTRTFTK
jgi:hypothetical protein